MDKRVAHLVKSDPVLGAVIKKIGVRRFGARPNYFKLPKQADHFRALVVAIINQQLSTKAADTIERRFIELFPGKKFPSPRDVIKMPFRKMRKAGLSGAKVGFIKDLAKKVLAREVDLKKIDAWTDAEVIEHLTAVKGIGVWTAEMFLMFSLGRGDIFSYGDLGLRNAMQKIYGLRKHPSPERARKITMKWSPYRTLGCRYLWASLELK